jgi:transcriptional regulator with XRE-family HTH domain
MSESKLLFAALKQVLKSRGKTYRDVAQILNLSEASIKRIFATCDLSLNRLDFLCQWLDISIADLAEQAEANRQHLHYLSQEQEQLMVSDPKLLLITTCVLNYWQFTEITDYYQISQPECIQKLIQLERIGLLELQPNNRIKLRVSPTFRWRENGPIQNFFQKDVGEEFFASRFTKQGEQLIVLNGTLSDKSITQFHRKVAELTQVFNKLSQEDAKLPLEQRIGTTTILATRRWTLRLFDKFKRIQ